MSLQDSSKRQRCSPDQPSPETKRARPDLSYSAGPDPVEVLMPLDHPSSQANRDPIYYFDDGSCVILVQDTLFNVHRSILSKDSSSFGTMFSLPQGSQAVEGSSDISPIVISGDTVSEFRNFLWALYALPPELRVATSPDADVDQLVDIARVSSKYSFKSLELWALDAIHDYVNRKPSPILSGLAPTHPSTNPFSIHPEPSPTTVASVQNTNTAQLTKLIRLAQTCGHKPLLDTLIEHLRLFMSLSLQYAYLAMSIADELDVPTLRGVAYFEVMQKAVIDQSKPSITSPATSPPFREGDLDPQGRLVISRAQQLRLLTGYYRLSRVWEGLRASPPSFDHAPSCGATWHQHGCSQSWLEFWKEKVKTDTVLALGLADAAGRLKQIQKEFDKWGSAPYMHHDCRTIARKIIQDSIKRIENKLPDYFSEDGGDDL